MRKILILIFLNIVLSLVQTSFFPALFARQIVVNWVFAFGLSWLLANAPITALKSVFIGGILLDILIGTRLGLSSLIMTSGVYALILVRSYLFKGLVPHFIIGSLVAYLYYSLVIGLSGTSFDTFFYSVLTVLFSIIFSILMRQLLSSRN